MKILAIGDVCSFPGRQIIRTRLGRLRKELGADLVILNGENTTDVGKGITPEIAEELFMSGGDVITLGNHGLNAKKIYDYLDESRYIIRPANMPAPTPGQGYTVIECLGKRVCVINLLGRVNMSPFYDSPFEAADRIISRKEADIYIVDFHAEATSEKKALGYYLDGRCSVVFGTHTHVPTADLHIMPKGCGYITDVGMTGGQQSVLGVKAEQSIAFFLGHPGVKFEYADTDCRIQGALFTLDEKGRCTHCQMVDYR